MFVSTLTEINLVLKGGISHRLSSTKTLKLKSGYKVKYEANAPSGCNASINLEETYYAYDTVKFTNQTLECDGYQFKGWESVQKVKKVNDDNFIMPSNDVIIRGTWSKVTLNKSMQGKIYERLSLYDTIALTSYLEDTVWCNDRTIYKLGGWEANGGSTRDSALYFGVYGRIIKSNPSLSCRKIDSFTTLTNNGNGALNYPVGLLTADEIMYAGEALWKGKVALIDATEFVRASTYGSCTNMSSAKDMDCYYDNWLIKNNSYWTMTPYSTTLTDQEFIASLRFLFKTSLGSTPPTHFLSGRFPRMLSLL